MKRRPSVTVTFTHAQADALRWLANDGLDCDPVAHPATLEACRRGLEKLTRALGLIPYRRGRSVYGRLTRHDGGTSQH